jgi:hypothetical protein
MEAPALANFYDLTQDDAPVAQLPEVIDLVSSDEDEPPRKKVRPFIERWADDFANTADAAAEQLAGVTEEEFDERVQNMDRETRVREEKDRQFGFWQEFDVAHPGPFRRLEPSTTQDRLPLRYYYNYHHPHDHPQMGGENISMSLRNRLGPT